MTTSVSPSEEGEARLRRTPTIARVTSDTIIELVYDPDRRQTSLVVSRFGGLWNIEKEVQIGEELLVPYSARNNLIASECVLLPSAPVEFGTKEELIADIRAFLHRYVDLSPVFENVAAHYVLLTWVHDRFSDLGYLRLRGEFGTGKTRGLMAIGSLCYRAFFASGASTVSSIFHILDAFGGTLVFDEADLPYSDARADLVKLLNNGTTQGMPVLRTIVNSQREFNPRAFRVFGPKIVAMRGTFDDAALESRFITEETGMRAPRRDIPIHLPLAFKAEARALRNRLLHYRLVHLFATQPDPSALMESVAPRVNQSAFATLSLVDDPELRNDIRHLLVDQDERLKAERQEAVDVQVLKAAHEAFRAADGADVPLRTIAETFNAAHCAEYGRPISNKWIGHILRKQLHLSTAKSGGVYIVRWSELPKIEGMAKRFGIARESPEASSS